MRAQAVTFLVIHQKHKKSLEEITNDLCPVLSVQQLYRISTMYWDDRYNTETVSHEACSCCAIFIIMCPALLCCAVICISFMYWEKRYDSDGGLSRGMPLMLLLCYAAPQLHNTLR